MSHLLHTLGPLKATYAKPTAYAFLALLILLLTVVLVYSMPISLTSTATAGAIISGLSPGLWLLAAIASIGFVIFAIGLIDLYSKEDA